MERSLGPFVIESLLGEGAVGRVHRARHRGSGEQVALKVLWPQHRASLRSLVLREVAAAARLDHPGAVWVHDFGEDPEEGPWVALELLTGGALADRLPLPGWTSFSELAQALLSALGHAHARDVLHRDVKPANVLFGGPDDPRPGPRLVDFGVAAVGRGGGLVAATPDYAAPEQLAGALAEEGPWTDLHALAATLWHAACGVPPSQARAFDPAFPVPPGLREWLLWMLAPLPADRPANAVRAAEALRALGPPVGPEPSAAASRRTFDDTPDVALALRPHPRRSPASLRLFALRPVPLAGRGREQTALVRWACGEGPALRTVTGPQGIGKTHLLRWLAVHLRERDLAWVVPVSLHRAAPLARGLQDAWVPGLRATNADGAALADLARFASTADRPVVVTVDEADGRSGRALVARLAAIPGLRVLHAGTDLGGPDGLALGPVDPVALMRAIGVTEAELPARIADRTGGHPGHTVRMVSDLVRRGALVPGRRGYTLAPGAALTFPDGPLEAARSAVANLPAAPSLAVAAALGPSVERRVWDGVLARLALARDRAVEDEWIRAGLVRRTRQRLWFTDPLVREVLCAQPAERLVAIAAAAADETAERPDLAAEHAEWTLAAGRRAEAAPKLRAAAFSLRHPWSRDRAWHLLDLVGQALPALDPVARGRMGADIVRLRAALVAQSGDAVRAIALLEALCDLPDDQEAARMFLLAQIELWGGRHLAARRRLDAIPPERRTKPWCAVRSRVALELSDRDEARAWLAAAPETVERGHTRGTLALVERDAAALAVAIDEVRRLGSPESTWPQKLEAVGAVLGLVDAPLPETLDRAIGDTVARGLPVMHLILEAAGVRWAAACAPEQVPARLAAATSAIAATDIRFALVHELLVEAASLAPAAHRPALLALAETQVPLDAP